MRIKYVSNLPSDLASGGFSGMNVAMLAALQQRADVAYVGPINPPPSRLAQIWSKLFRALGFPGQFFFFSKPRLRSIADQVALAVPEANTEFIFFHGFTPWVSWTGAVRYAAWSDCTFRDYIDVYHQRAQFDAADLKRIEEMEAAWLRRAEKVLFTSRWAAERAIGAYRLIPAKVEVVGIYGAVEPPVSDGYSGGSEFAFVSTDFRAKGGLVVAEAFGRLRQSYPEVRLIVVGDAPSSEVQGQPGVSYAGFLRKEAPQELGQFCAILARVRAVVHPTRADISPLLFIEAAYFGCPVIASRRYAIPEIVVEGATGLLLDDPDSVEAVTKAMQRLLEMKGDYLAMRKAAWAHSRKHFSRENFQERVWDALSLAA